MAWLTRVGDAFGRRGVPRAVPRATKRAVRRIIPPPGRLHACALVSRRCAGRRSES